MSTVLGTPRSIDDVNLEDLDEERAGAEIVRRMEALWPDERFHAVPGGEANGEWNLLVRGNDWSTPTAEMVEALRDIVESVLCDSDEFYFSECPE